MSKARTQTSAFSPQRSTRQANGEPVDDQADGERTARAGGPCARPEPRAKKTAKRDGKDTRRQAEA